MLAETATTAISNKQEPKTFNANKQAARDGGDIAGGAKKKLEKRLGRLVVSKNNFLKNSENKMLR